MCSVERCQVLNESIPHVIASLFTHLLATGKQTTPKRDCTDWLKQYLGWGTYQIVNTNKFKSDFSRLTTDGACGVNLLPTYWGSRRSAEVASLSLNALALLIGIVLSCRLVKVLAYHLP